MKKAVTFFLLLLTFISCTGSKQLKNNIAATDNDTSLYLLIGTYTTGTSKGIYVYRFNTEQGNTSYVSCAENISNPSYLAISHDKQYVYAVSENGGEQAKAHAFSFDPQRGVLSPVNSRKTGSDGPCYIETSPSGKYVITANYSGGSISVFPVNNNSALDSLSQLITFEGKSIAPEQKASHLHCVKHSPDGKYLFADDLGTDKIYIFKTNENRDDTGSHLYLQASEPAEIAVKAGSGPRHLVFHPNKNFAYLINELSGEITSFDYTEGKLSSIQYIASDTIARPQSKGSADIHIGPDGRFLYASNRLQADGIAIFSIHPKTGILTRTGYQPTGIHPRNFIITPDGRFLLVANRDSNNIQIFRIDSKTGLLKNTGKEIPVDKPVCLQFIQ